MTDKLLPCPFCGGNDIQTDEMESFWDKNETSWRVLCIDCIAETAGDTKEQAIAAWNRRAPDIVYCRECQYYRDLMCWHHTEPCTNAKGYKGEVVCVEPDDFCSHGVRSKP